ncbi:hypothetical protein LIER_36750 [Lithospermum erythrorhizon]|uniref:Reverse transcriptase domain-containing protein n=1 Tax=Lithospermum erythrorhizon TaxID=34254 RepID=A0AAV3PAA8_LITER
MYEVHHVVKKKRVGSHGFFSLKLDKEKAYDRVEWGYLKNIMITMGFPVKLVYLIMDFITSVSYSVLVNGERSRHIIPSRGLRQGYPLSLYLFILCTEGLIALINAAVARGEWNGVRIGRSGPMVSHMLFAYDSLLFARASVDQCGVIKQVLHHYEQELGQRVNYAKSAISLNPNVGSEVRQEICRVLDVDEVAGHDKYLGLPTFARKSKLKFFSSITGRVKSKVEGWLRLPKEEGGLGLRSLVNMNSALLTKQAWRLVEDPESTLVKAYKVRYFPDTNSWDAMIGCSPSFTWRSILQSREVLRRGCRWILGDGNTIRIWQDTWVQGDSVEKLISPAPLGFEHARVVVLIGIEGKR